MSTQVGNGIAGKRVGFGRVAGRNRTRKTVMVQQVRALQVRAWRSGEGERRWLSMLIGAMERVASPEFRATPCDPKVISALRVQLARPASPYPYWHAPSASRFGLRN